MVKMQIYDHNSHINIYTLLNPSSELSVCRTSTLRPATAGNAESSKRWQLSGPSTVDTTRYWLPARAILLRHGRSSQHGSTGIWQVTRLEKHEETTNWLWSKNCCGGNNEILIHSGLAKEKLMPKILTLSVSLSRHQADDVRPTSITWGNHNDPEKCYSFLRRKGVVFQILEQMAAMFHIKQLYHRTPCVGVPGYVMTGLNQQGRMRPLNWIHWFLCDACNVGVSTIDCIMVLSRFALYFYIDHLTTDLKYRQTELDEEVRTVIIFICDPETARLHTVFLYCKNL